MEELQRLIVALKKKRDALGSLVALSRDSGIPTRTLTYWLGGRREPSKPSIQRIRGYLGEEREVPPEEISGVGISVITEAEERTEKIKYLLVLVYYELRWFIEAPRQARETFRENISLEDVGYLGSLLTMLAEEKFFQRWKGFTTSEFSKFGKGGNS